MTETDLMHAVMLAVTEAGNQIFRTNVGKVRTPDGRYFDTGLPKGHSDLYGFRPDGQIFYIETFQSTLPHGSDLSRRQPRH